ncbi:MAG: prepilin-type N-terminal cleavage/methylation domain-containing protein [Deltaproteobacteria bacterium]|nr:prepilin-type N-terminal cleavage/methylation domain-containing protein [Candidatus Zymogenaceae bacterium]
MKSLRQALQRLRSGSGFTLVEILIAVAISLVIMAAIFEVFISQKRRYVSEDVILEMDSSGNLAIEYLSRIIQNSGYNISHGMKIESASDHYFTTVLDENDNGVVEADEVVTISVNTPIRDIGTNEQPTEIVFDPELNAKYGGSEERYFDFYFDMDGDGTVMDSEVFESGYDLSDSPLDTDPDQMDAIKLYLEGPPYALYRYTYVLEDETSAYDASSNPYIVNPDPDVIAEDVDNFVIRYYDEENMPLPVAYDDNGVRIKPKPPYVLTREEMSRVRRVEFELLLRATREDPKWTDAGEYPVGSVATYDASGEPLGYSCSDTGYPPSACTDESLNSYDCFILYCADKEYPSYGEYIPYEDNFRRALFTASVYPKNLILNPYGTLSIEANPPQLQCPDTEVTLTATVRDREGAPIDGAVVNFYSSANVSILDFTSVSNTDGDGNPITDSNGEVTGITLKPWAKAGMEKLPVNVTVSADTSVTVTIGAVDKEFPFYDSLVVPFLMGPPDTLTLSDPSINATACDADDTKPIEIEARDCNDFKVTDAVIDLEFLVAGSPPTTDIDPGKFYITYDEGVTKEYDHDTNSNGKNEAIETDELADRGMYFAWFQPPTVESPATSYPDSVDIVVTAVEFDGRDMYAAEPTGWGLSTTVEASKTVTLEEGRPYRMAVDPTAFNDEEACRGKKVDFDVICYDCGNKRTDKRGTLDYNIMAYIEAPVYGEVTDKDEDPLSGRAAPNTDCMPWGVITSRVFTAFYLVTGCANTDAEEHIKLVAVDPDGNPYADPEVISNLLNSDLPDPDNELVADLTNCPEGLNIILSALEQGANPGDGTGNSTDGFLQNGCDFDVLDVRAKVTLNIPPTINCDDVAYNPVDFTITGGQARFYDGAGYSLTSVTVNTDDEGNAYIGIQLLSAVEDVTIKAHSVYGLNEGEETYTLAVGTDDVLKAYRDYCYTDLLSSSNPIWTGDYVYLEVNDCFRNISGGKDDVYVKAYEWTSGFADEEDLDETLSANNNKRLVETGNDTGRFRGRVPTRGLISGTTSTDNDGMLEVTNGGHFNARYWDKESNEVRLYDSDFVQTIVDICDGGIKFSEPFSYWENQGRFNFIEHLTNDATPLLYTAWAGFGTIGITTSSSPEWPPSTMASSDIPELYQHQILQYCDELYMSGSVPFSYGSYMHDGTKYGTLIMPPSTTPEYVWENTETFAWVDLDESVVGADASEALWQDYVVSFRYKYIAETEDTDYAGTNYVTASDYYLPGIDKGVCFIFRANASEAMLTAMTDNPTMNMMDTGYILVWTEDSSGDPLARLLRVDWVDRDVFPVDVEITQVGSDVTLGGEGFNKYFDSGDYDRIYARIEGNEFYLYIDDFFLDFDGGGGASATDVVYHTGTVGIGVKDIIAKFDNFQVCGCPPMSIAPADPTTVSDDMAAGTPVTLTLTDLLTGIAASGTVSWDVFPSTCGTFSSNPSTGGMVVFTGNGVDFPDYFTASTSNGCVGSFYPTSPTPTSYVDDFEDQDKSRWTNACDSYWSIDSYAGGYSLYRDSSGGRFTYIIDPAAQPSWETSDTLGLAYDNYTAEVDVYLDDASNTESGGSVAYLVTRVNDCSHFYVMGIRNSWNENWCPSVGYGAEIRFSVYNGYWSCSYGAQFDTPHPYFAANTKYHMIMECVNNTINCEVQDEFGAVIHSFSYTDTGNLFPTGPPGVRMYGDGVHFDNFTITPGS